MKKKRLFSFLLALAVIMSIAAVSFAAEAEAAAATATTYSYSFNIPYPPTGSGQTSGIGTAAGGMSPWFKPSISTVRTVYWIIPSGASINTLATNIAFATSTTKQYLTYKTGYGGAGTTYRLVGGGATDPYDPYNARGTWSPD